VNFGEVDLCSESLLARRGISGAGFEQFINRLLWWQRFLNSKLNHRPGKLFGQESICLRVLVGLRKHSNVGSCLSELQFWFHAAEHEIFLNKWNTHTQVLEKVIVGGIKSFSGR